MTKEGPSAWREAINALKGASPKKAYVWCDALHKAAKDHCNDMGPKGRMGHGGSDGSNMKDRIERHGKPLGRTGENIAYAFGDGRNMMN